MKMIDGIKNETDYINKVTQSVREIREALHIFTKKSVKNEFKSQKLSTLFFSGGEDTDFYT